jgi:hypothetical protein
MLKAAPLETQAVAATPYYVPLGAMSRMGKEGRRCVQAAARDVKSPRW